MSFEKILKNQLLRIFMAVIIMPVLAMCLVAGDVEDPDDGGGCSGGGGDYGYGGDDYTGMTINTNDFGGVTTPEEWVELFFEDPAHPKLTLAVPGYVYFQGVVYSKGKVIATGPIRIIGGLICNKADDGSSNEIELRSGTMLTTNLDYLKDRVEPVRDRFEVVMWKEVGTEIDRELTGTD